MKIFTKKLFLFIFLSILILPVSYAAEADKVNFGDLEVPLESDKKSVDDIAKDGLLPYVAIVIKFVTVSIIIIGVIMIVVGGFTYMTAGGDSGKLGQAKTFIGAALLGIILALASYLILNTISPQFTSDLKEPKELLKVKRSGGASGSW